MNFGLYSAYLGMRARQQQMDLIANNIANASTTGFKADHLHYSSVEAAQNDASQAAATPGGLITAGLTPPGALPSAAIPPASTGIDPKAAQLTPIRNGREFGVATSESTDFSAGPIRETGNSLDLALDGDAFFVVQTPRGERYTRQGSLTLDNSGQLVTQQGDLVVGDSGPITVPNGQVNVANDGTISVGGKVAGQLKLVHFTNPGAALSKEGNSLFVATGKEQPLEATSSKVVQGALESSNVSSLTEMVAMMQNTRQFDSLQRSVSTLINDLGRKISGDIGKI